MAKNNAAKGRQGASGAVSERNNINKFRKKRAARKLWLNLGILTLIILVMILVVINWSRIIAPLKDAALDVGKDVIRAAREVHRESALAARITSWTGLGITSAC